MSTIVTRIGKGSSLTWQEMDDNLTNLNTDKLEAGFPASNVANTPAGSISATDVQAALNELDTEKASLAALAASSGSSIVGFVQSGTGAVNRNLQTKVREFISVEDFGAVGDGINDDTAEIQAALNAHLNVDFGSKDKTYKVSAALALRTGHNIVGRGAKIQQITNNTEIFNIDSKSDITIEGLYFYGVGTDYVESDSSRASAIMGTGSKSRIKVNNNRFENFGYTSLHARDITDVEFCNNIVVGPGSPILTSITSGRCYGVLFNSGCFSIICTGNNISNAAQGIRIEKCIRSVISNNNIFDIIGQHGVYAGPNTQLSIANNNINNIDLIGIKVQASEVDGACYDISITGNTIDDCGDQGILLCNGAGSSPTTNKVNNATVTGNTIRIVTATSINIQNVLGGTVTGNSCTIAGFSGINISASDYVIIDSNDIITTQLSGIRSEAVSSNITVSNNKIHNAAGAATAGDRYGIYFSVGSSIHIHDNWISDVNAKMDYGIYLDGTITQTSCSVYNNHILNAVLAGGKFKASGDSMLTFRDNHWAVGSSGPLSTAPGIVQVASASTLAVPSGTRVAFVTGTTTINNIQAGRIGELLTLIFSDALTVVRSGSITLNASLGNFVTTGGDTLTLAPTGVNSWYEVSRSVN